MLDDVYSDIERGVRKHNLDSNILFCLLSKVQLDVGSRAYYKPIYECLSTSIVHRELNEITIHFLLNNPYLYDYLVEMNVDCGYFMIALYSYAICKIELDTNPVPVIYKSNSQKTFNELSRSLIKLLEGFYG